jgi:hypothetical protein
MYWPSCVFPYQRVPAQWYVPEFVLTQTFVLGSGLPVLMFAWGMALG